MKMTYYKIIDRNLLGRQIDFRSGKAEIFSPNSLEWVPDTEHVVKNRLIGYDPYDGVIGSTDVLSQIEEVTAAEAEEIIKGIKQWHASKATESA